MKISYFGDQRSHTYAAALDYLREAGISGAQDSGYDTVYETLQAVVNGKCDIAIVPMENSLEGTVTATADALSELELYIVGEVVLPIRQNLIVKKGVTLADIQTVYSHPQALAQCRNTLRALLPKAKTEAVAYTSAALAKLNEHSAAIARAPEKGQTVLRENIADDLGNCTRFVAVAKNGQMERGNKVSIFFATPNVPGALWRVLNVLKAKGLNMTKIESRPSKMQMGKYVFYVDFTYYDSDEALKELLESLRTCTAKLRFLGRYGEKQVKPREKVSRAERRQQDREKAMKKEQQAWD